MTLNKEDLKNKIIYRASYRGTKEMDILMIAFVKSLINDLDENFLKTLDSFVDIIWTVKFYYCFFPRNIIKSF